MNSSLKKTLSGLIILSFVFLVAGLLLFKTILSPWSFKFFPFLVLIFLTVNSGFFILFYRSLRKSDAQFVRTFMLATFLKLIIYLALVLVYVLSSPKTAVVFSITLSALYITYTAYDLYMMLYILRNKKENTSMTN